MKQILCYGSVPWTQTQMTEQMLCTFERKILRRIYSPVQYKGHCRPRWNNEIYNLYQDTNIVGDIKIIRLGWAGHFIRTEDERIPKKVLNGKFHNTRPVGKQITRWEDDVRKDTSQIIGYEDGGDEQKTEKNGGVFQGRPGPIRGRSDMDGWMDGSFVRIYIVWLVTGLQIFLSAL